MKNLLKSILSTALAVCMILGCITCVSADTSSVPLSGNYTFLNVAYSPDSDTYVAVAKDLTSTNHTMQTLVSKNGYSWSVSKTFSSAKTNQNSNSHQILSYWSSQKVFVVAAANKVYYSADGLSWTQLRAFGNPVVLDTNGTNLFVGWYAKVAVYDSLTTYQDISLDISQWISFLTPSNTGVLAIQKDVTYGGYRWFVSKTSDEYTATRYNNIKDNYGYSIAYIPNSDKALITYLDSSDSETLVNSVKIHQITPSTGDRQHFTVNLKNGDTATENTSAITAVGYANGKTYLGTKDGKIYYTSENTDITNDTVWNVLTNASENTEEIKAIAQGKDGAVAVSAKKVFLISGDSYKDVNDGFFIGAPTLKGVNIFSGVSLYGGAYGEGIGYVVYGNTTDGKGNIYFSEDGIEWELVHSSGNKFNLHQNGTSISNYNTCVYMENNGLFLINMGGSLYGCCFYSFNGRNWNFSDTIPGCRDNGGIGLAYNGSIAVNGDYIYTSGEATASYSRTKFEFSQDMETGARIISGYTSERISGSDVSGASNYYFPFITVSNETNPFIFMNVGYGVTFTHDTSTNEFNLGYGFINANVSTVFKEAKWNSELSKFVGVRTDANKAYIVGKDRSVKTTQTASSNLSAFDTNGTNYVFGTVDGKLYKVANTALETAAMTEISGTNALPVQSIIKGIDGGFLAVATNSTDSDILLVNAGCTAYEKASDKAVVTPAPDNKAVLSIDAVNNTDTPVTFKMITAIYDGNKLVQTVMSDKSIAAGNTGAITEEITFNENVNENCTMRVYMWGGDNFMNPIAGATDFFQ